MKTVRVGLGARSYDVLVDSGLIARAGELMRPFLPRGRTAVVTDETVERLHGAELKAALKAQGIASDWIVMPPGEGTKSWQGLAEVSDRLLALGLDRGDVVTAFGGGVSMAVLPPTEESTWAKRVVGIWMKSTPRL